MREFRCRLDSTKRVDQFDDGKDYRYDLNALESAQSTFNEEGLYVECVALAKAWSVSSGRKAKILDLCCATGLFSYRIAREIPVASVTLIDTDPVALDWAVGKLSSILLDVTTHCADAATFSEGNAYDLVLMNSAYHHIPDSRKVSFLQSAHRSLAATGRILLGEHFLPPYRNQDEFHQSVVDFYSSLNAALQARGESQSAIDAIRCAARHTLRADYEFKVSWERFEQDLVSASLKIESFAPVWQPPVSTSAFVGSAAIWLGPA